MISGSCKKKNLNLFQTPNYKGETIAKAIESCLSDWRIKYLLTATLDNAATNDAAITHLKGRTSVEKVLSWKIISYIVRCNAHILHLIVKKGLSEWNKSISRVRNVVKYVKSSCARTTSFKSYVEKVKLDTHGVLILKNVETRWNSKYLMLILSSNLKRHFQECILMIISTLNIVLAQVEV